MMDKMTIEVEYDEESNTFQATCKQFNNMRVRGKTAKNSVISLLGSIELIGVRLDVNERWENKIKQINREKDEEPLPR